MTPFYPEQCQVHLFKSQYFFFFFFVFHSTLSDNSNQRPLILFTYGYMPSHLVPLKPNLNAPPYGGLLLFRSICVCHTCFPSD